ncbi:hypothetical protein [Actinocorallia sp. A-T 12471]|uniref:hypothetical protein n=1 Tax=Actinocorallia sp. A-T 12471 TaxID=3089813 RepID=UPI0029D24CEC|nr:hypothetical protein [Actinocorallia sp. A-T 12471]MDX6738403.1 hypothetical protein [Actinocorallia sp. A-T 12471]
MHQPPGSGRRTRARRRRRPVSARSAFAAGIVVGACVVLAGVALVSAFGDEQPDGPPATEGLAASAKPTGVFSRAFAGTWRGALATEDPGWEVQLALPEGEGTGSVQYYQHGRIECSGTVQFVKAAKAELRLDERTPNCSPNKSGIVRLTPRGKGLRHQWYANENDLAEQAPSFDGTLKKVG